MNLEMIKSLVKTKVYHVDPTKVAPLHRHSDNDEIYYCIQGEGFVVYENGEQEELNSDKVVMVKAGIKHTAKTDTHLDICSFLIPKNR